MLLLNHGGNKMTNEKLNEIKSRILPLIEEMKKISEDFEIYHFDIGRLSTGKFEFMVYEDVDDPNYFSVSEIDFMGDSVETETRILEKRR